MGRFLYCWAVAGISLGCGANVVFVEEGASGGGGSGAGGTASTGGSGNTDCSEPLEGERYDFCFQYDSVCPPSASGVVIEAATKEVALLSCPDECCSYYVNAVPCGPTTESGDGNCCYGADILKAVGCG